ncbi:hypothetical protein DRP07_00310 [Archaeoglobales archaeon]|nr:MAG: hypothetical protein DRP07_00310 [Archaeoglobales archaeon]
MAEYYIVPRPGYREEDIFNLGFNHKTVKIVKIVDGMEVESHVYDEINAKRWRARPHPVFFKRKGWVEMESRIVTFPDIFFEGFISVGWCPFKQIIYMFCDEARATHKEEIISYIVRSKKYLRNNKHNRWWLGELIEYMVRQGWLNRRDSLILPGDRRIPIGPDRIMLKEGYNPIHYHMMRRIQYSGRATRGEIGDYMIRDLGFIEYDVVLDMNSEEVLDAHLNYLEEEGYIKEVAKDTYEVIRPLERYI